MPQKNHKGMVNKMIQSFKIYAICVIRMLTSRAFAVSALSIVMATVIYWAASLTNIIYIYDDDTTICHYTFEKDPNSILEENGIVTMSADEVNFSGIEDGIGEISITRAFPVTVVADDQTHQVDITGGTVETLLTKMNIPFDSGDIIIPEPHKELVENDKVLLKRVEQGTRTEKVEVPYETETRPTPLLGMGRTMTLQEGSNGIKSVLYEQEKVDGVVQKESLLEEKVEKLPVKEILLQGTKTPVSPLDFGISVDENGVPEKYSKVLTNQIATGYNAGSYAWGASGKTLSAGYVAVHPEEIPYGTKMYIASPDGSFVYGFAVAADTGTGLLDNIIDVDLYYDTYAESCLNGRKYVDIYILE